MPLQRRLPKVGFVSTTRGDTDEVRLHELGLVSPGDDVIDILSLKSAGIVAHRVKRVKVIASGVINKAVKLKGLAVTPGARAAIEAAGGSVED